MATFSELYTEVRKGIGNRPDIDTEIKSAVNDAVVDLTLMFKIRQAVGSYRFYTSEGVYSYELQSDVLDVISVRNLTLDVPLVKSDYLTFDSLDYDNTTSYGDPTNWFVDGRNLIVFNATPDAEERIITYRYLVRPTDMVDDDESFPLPREWERPCKLLAKSYVFELLGQADKAAAAFQQMVGVVTARKEEGYWEDYYSKDARANFGPFDWED